MKVLVTGGAGFVGSHIVDKLVEKGHKVVVVDNLFTGNKKYVNKLAKFYKRDITKKIDDIFKKERPKYVLHVAAQVMLRDSLDKPTYDATINILGTINVLECCRKYKVKKIIYTSTGGARYGEPIRLPVKETDPIRPESPYGISKHTAEHYIEAYSKLYGIDHLIFCFGNVYGPRDDPNCKRVTSIFLYQMLLGKQPIIFGDGKQTRDFIFVLDIAEFIVKVMKKRPKHRLFNLANSSQISVNEIFLLLKEYIGFDKDAKHIKAIKGEIRDIRLDTTLAKKELGWRPKHDFKKGLKLTAEWFKKSLKKSSKSY